jgi:hypothetical protein
MTWSVMITVTVPRGGRALPGEALAAGGLSGAGAWATRRPRTTRASFLPTQAPAAGGHGGYCLLEQNLSVTVAVAVAVTVLSDK